VMAVALGSGLLVALVAITQIADSRVVSELGKGGPATAIHVSAAAPNPGQLDVDNPTTGPAKPIDAGALAAIRRSPHVSSVAAFLAVPVEVIPPPRGSAIPTLAGSDPDRHLVHPFDDTLVGADLSHEADLPVSLLAGSLPAAGSTTEVAVTTGYLDHLGLDVNRPQAVVGTEVEIGGPQAVAVGGADLSERGRWSLAVITGVVAQQVASGDVYGSIQLAGLERDWELDGADGTSIGLPPPVSPYSGLVVVADSLDDIHTVRAEITAIGYSTSAPEQLVATVQKYLHVVDIVLGSIGVVALLIACLGISNALLAAVRERRRDIGILKAIGARDSDVLRWFLAEALLSGAVGGAIGALLGLAAVLATGAAVNSYLVSQGLSGVQLGGFPWQVELVGLGGSVVLALAAAAWPSLRAARVPAREVMQGL